ncbi:acyl-CoA dehydrogenase family protein [Rhodococcus sp. P1Y]|uniref:acyl-CoA dehydrogenase family protein n=1 Tax=Rhodococcus sp. P1Y TaxID=1302308 RepID=UPI000EAFF638|nr:acyl-CoA dehydrogenase family protein [Rhodococcus sp. P1Y]AYJ52089.1 acyl-CoA dehydrogenase [Rhodococcus sp. P1Y]
MSIETQDLSEFHDDLRSVARDLLARSGPGENAPWQPLVDSGFLALEVPEAFDGADATLAETAVVLTEMGRTAAAGPYAGIAVLGLALLDSLSPSTVRDALYASTVTGAARPVAVIPGEGPDMLVARLEHAADGYILDGTVAFVLDAPAADNLLIPALAADGSVVVVHLEPNVPGLDIVEHPVLDSSRSLGSVVADNVAVRADSVWRFEADGRIALQRLNNRAAIAVACDSVGLSEAMLDATVAFAGEREQFDRKVGSFQAVKHACADMLVQLTVAKKLVAAAVSADRGGVDEAAVAASMAKSFACSMAVQTAGKAMQLHGGMGYTWESGIHVYLKRAALNRSLFGSPAQHRARLARRYG